MWVLAFATPNGTCPAATCARRFDVAALVVEEEVGLELAQELALVQAAEEHRLVDVDVPVHQRADRALVRRRAARGDQRGADAHRPSVPDAVLQPVQRLEQRLERARRQRLSRMVALVRAGRRRGRRLVHALGLVGEQHRVAVEGDAHLVGVPARGARRLRVDARRRERRRRAPRARRPRWPTGTGWRSAAQVAQRRCGRA